MHCNTNHEVKENAHEESKKVRLGYSFYLRPRPFHFRRGDPSATLRATRPGNIKYTALHRGSDGRRQLRDSFNSVGIGLRVPR